MTLVQSLPVPAGFTVTPDRSSANRALTVTTPDGTTFTVTALPTAHDHGRVTYVATRVVDTDFTVTSLTDLLDH